MAALAAAPSSMKLLPSVIGRRQPPAAARAAVWSSRARVRSPTCVRVEAMAFAGTHDARASASASTQLVKRRCLRRDATTTTTKTKKTTCRVVVAAASAQDDEGEVSGVTTVSADESLDCVVVGMEAACVVGENESEGNAVEGVDDKYVGASDEAAAADETASSGVLGLLGGMALVSPFFLWGTSMVAMKEVLPATSPLFVASVRLVPAGAVLIAWAASKGRPWPKGGMAWMAIALFSLVDGTAFQGCLSEGLQRTSAGLGSVIIDSQPLTVAILASIIYGETLAPAGVFGLLVLFLSLSNFLLGFFW